MSKVELIYDLDCPNVAAARKNLMRSFAQAEIRPEWTEWDRASPDAPAYARQYGSPTILVDERDVSGEQSGPGAASCRVYLNSDENNKRVPSVEMIVGALSTAGHQPQSGNTAGFFGGLAVAPGAAAAFLAKAACPLCYPAIAGLFSSLGLGFLFNGTYFLIIAAVFLGVVLFGLGYRARTRRGYGPLWLGLAAAAMIIAARFLWDESTPIYTGISALIVASAWNLLPKRAPKDDSCPSCATDGATSHSAQGE